MAKFKTNQHPVQEWAWSILPVFFLDSAQFLRRNIAVLRQSLNLPRMIS
jgi:hypothetical protein